MNIKKVDEKPMVIHTKQKAKIHSVSERKVSIKGRNIYTVKRVSPKARIKAINVRGGSGRKMIRKKTYRRSTIHKPYDKKQLSNKYHFRDKDKSRASIKVKNTSIHVAEVGARRAASQVEGGKEMSDALASAYVMAMPVTGTVSKGASLYRRQKAINEKKKIKKVDAAKKIAKKDVKGLAISEETTSQGNSVRFKKKFDRSSEYGKSSSSPINKKSTSIKQKGGKSPKGKSSGKGKKALRLRKIQSFIDNNKGDGEQSGVVNLAKNFLKGKAIGIMKVAAPLIGFVLVFLLLVVSIVTMPVMAIVALIYSSPFAIFLPPLEDGDSTTTVASAYIAEFNREVNDFVDEHSGYDMGKKVYVDYEGMNSTPDNYYDILAVYMVKYGVGDTATIMNSKSKDRLQDIVNDMCSYTTSGGTETITNSDGTTTSKSCLYVNLELKTWRDMVSEYGFNDDEQELLAEFMSPESLEMLGYSGSNVSTGSDSIEESEINSILSAISAGKARDACDFALHRVGYPYSQDNRDSGSAYDCSSLVYYAWKDAGIDISYNDANSAAAEAEGLQNAGYEITYDDIEPGDLIFYSYTANGRFMNISHVAMYVGNDCCVEAQDESTGVVYGPVPSKGKIVMVARPQ